MGRSRAAGGHHSPALLPMILTSILVLALAGAIAFLSGQEPLPMRAAAGPAKLLPEGVHLGKVPASGDREEVANMVTNPVGAAEEAAARTGEYPVTPEALIAPVEEWILSEVTAFEERADPGDGAHLEIGWAPILMAGPYLGLDLTATITGVQGGSGDETRVAHRIVYADVTGADDDDADDGGDTAGAGVWAAPEDVFAAGAADRIAGLVRQAYNQPELADRPHPSAEEAADLAARAMSTARLDGDGLVLPLDPDVPGGPALALDQERAEPLLTGPARRILAAAVAGEEYAGIPAPEPPPSPPGPLDFPITVDCEAARCIALTFDDGPGPETDRLLDILDEKDAPATFFVLGEQVRKRPEVVRRMTEAGHVVGNHTWGHPDLATLSRKEIDRQIATAADEIEKAGAPRPVLLRPPYGSFSDDVRAAIAAGGAAAVLWDVDTLDWKTRDTEKTVEAALEGAGRGGIILMHDIHAPTVDAVPEIIDGLRADGYTLATVPDLFGGSLTEGEVYRHAG